MNKSFEYINVIKTLIEKVEQTQISKIERAARIIADALENGNRIHAFGTGHSHILSEEIFYRAGGLVNINPIFESSLMLHESASKSTKIERLSGYGDIIFDHYGLKKDDVLFVFSNSGRNGVSIDLAKLATEKGLHVIVLTNMNHTMSGASRHESGKRLYEFAEIYIDNCGCAGDACVEIEGLQRRVSPTSTVIGAMILNAISARAVEMVTNDGFEAEVFSSSNVDGGDAINDRYIDKYKKEIKSL
ncbi:MAG TPA: SIS domain-containing protein [Clostridia bacterium]|nr:SIS domain-containing protein [Clostridia bacterium]